MTHASLFSGIGGPEVAAEMLGWENVFHCEINPFGRAVLEYYWPEAKSYDDIKKTDFREWRGRIDVLTGGFPCQPFSYAGRRGGADDDRYLWPEMLRAIDEIRPAWVVGENVAGIATMVEAGIWSDVGREATLFGEDNGLRIRRHEQRYTIERICADLEAAGYSVQPVIIPAASVGAPHRRDRIFFLAANAARSDDGRNAGSIRSEEGAERLQEWDEIRVAGNASEIRRALCGAIADAGRVRLEHDLGRGGEGTVPATQGGGRENGVPVEIQLAAPEGGGRPAADADCRRLSRRLPSDERKDTTEAGARLDNRAARSGKNGRASDTARRFCDGRVAGMPSRAEQSKSEFGNDSGAGDFAGVCDYLRPERRWRNFPTCAPVCRGNDGIPFPLDGLTIPANKWRTETLKAYGNAIVPQVMYRIFQAIEQVEREYEQR